MLMFLKALIATFYPDISDETDFDDTDDYEKRTRETHQTRSTADCLTDEIVLAAIQIEAESLTVQDALSSRDRHRKEAMATEQRNDTNH